MREAYPKFQERGAEVAVVTMGTPEQAAALWSRHRCGFPCFSDSQAEAYCAFGLERGGIAQLVTLRTISRAISSTLKGNYGGPIGDVFRMGGTFVIDREGVIRYRHRARDAADIAPIDEVIAAL